MIENDAQYQKALLYRRYDLERESCVYAALKQHSLTPEEIKTAMQPMRCFHAQLAEEIAEYEARQKLADPEESE